MQYLNRTCEKSCSLTRVLKNLRWTELFFQFFCSFLFCLRVCRQPFLNLKQKVSQELDFLMLHLQPRVPVRYLISWIMCREHCILWLFKARGKKLSCFMWWDSLSSPVCSSPLLSFSLSFGVSDVFDGIWMWGESPPPHIWVKTSV